MRDLLFIGLLGTEEFGELTEGIRLSQRAQGVCVPNELDDVTLNLSDPVPCNSVVPLTPSADQLVSCVATPRTDAAVGKKFRPL